MLYVWLKYIIQINQNHDLETLKLLYAIMIFVLDSFTRVINAATLNNLCFIPIMAFSWLCWEKNFFKISFPFLSSTAQHKGATTWHILAAESKILGGTSSHEAELSSHSQRFPYPLTPICNKNKNITTAINVFCLSYEIKWILYQPGSLNPKSRLIIMNMENINFSIWIKTKEIMLL